MPETPNHITIQVDQDALRKQVEDTLTKVFQEMSMRLRFAADELDKSDWINGFNEIHQQELKKAHERGIAEGRTAAGEKG